jgi:hypothetical protein
MNEDGEESKESRGATWLFLKKKPLIIVLSVYSNWRTAITTRAAAAVEPGWLPGNPIRNPSAFELIYRASRAMAVAPP